MIESEVAYTFLMVYVCICYGVGFVISWVVSAGMPEQVCQELSQEMHRDLTEYEQRYVSRVGFAVIVMVWLLSPILVPYFLIMWFLKRE